MLRVTVGTIFGIVRLMFSVQWLCFTLKAYRKRALTTSSPDVYRRFARRTTLAL